MTMAASRPKIMMTTINSIRVNPAVFRMPRLISRLLRRVLLPTPPQPCTAAAAVVYDHPESFTAHIFFRTLLPFSVVKTLAQAPCLVHRPAGVTRGAGHCFGLVFCRVIAYVHDSMKEVLWLHGVYALICIRIHLTPTVWTPRLNWLPKRPSRVYIAWLLRTTIF